MNIASLRQYLGPKGLSTMNMWRNIIFEPVAFLCPMIHSGASSGEVFLNFTSNLKLVFRLIATGGATSSERSAGPLASRSQGTIQPLLSKAGAHESDVDERAKSSGGVVHNCKLNMRSIRRKMLVSIKITFFLPDRGEPVQSNFPRKERHWPSGAENFETAFLYDHSHEVAALGALGDEAQLISPRYRYLHARPPALPRLPLPSKLTPRDLETWTIPNRADWRRPDSKQSDFKLARLTTRSFMWNILDELKSHNFKVSQGIFGRSQLMITLC
jgi:hypothetical protein